MEHILEKIAERERECSLKITRSAEDENLKLETLRAEKEKEKYLRVHEIQKKYEENYRTRIGVIEAEIEKELSQIRKEGELLKENKKLCLEIKNKIINILFA